MFHVKQFMKFKGDKMKLKKAFALLLCTSFLSTILISCENITPSIRTNEPDEKIEEGQVSQLPPTEEYKGTDFTVAVTEDKRYLFIRDEESESIVGAAVEKRNELIKQKYGVNVKLKFINEYDAMNELKNAKTASLKYADLLCLPGETLVLLAENNLLYNLMSSTSFDIDAEFINSVDAKRIAVNNSLYMIYDNAAQYYDNSWVTFYDKGLILNAGLTDPAILAENGEWTWPKLQEYSELVAKNVMNKQSVDTATDIFGFSAYYDDTELPLAMWESCGIPMFGNTYRQEVAVTDNLNKVKEAVGVLKNVYKSKSRYILDKSEAENAFIKGRLAFFISELDYSANLEKETEQGNYKREWGLLPLPKLSIQQLSYCAFIDSKAYALAIPENIEDPTKSVMLLNAFCAASGDAIKDAVYDKYVNKFFRNNTSTVVLKTILNTEYFDMAALFGSQMGRVADISTELIIDAIAKDGVIDRPISDKKAGFIKFSKKNFQ